MLIVNWSNTLCCYRLNVSTEELQRYIPNPFNYSQVEKKLFYYGVTLIVIGMFGHIHDVVSINKVRGQRFPECLPALSKTDNFAVQARFNLKWIGSTWPW